MPARCRAMRGCHIARTLLGVILENHRIEKWQAMSRCLVMN